MKARKYVLIAPLLIAIVLLSACGQAAKPVQQAQASIFVSGSNGLVMSFLPGQPPAEIPENVEFAIALNVENKGEKDVAIGAAEFWLEGIKYDEFGLSSAGDLKKPNTLSLTKTQKIQNQVAPGMSEQISFPGLKRNVALGTQLSFPIKAITQYPYETTMLGMVCLKQSVMQAVTGGPEICKLVQDVKPQNSGAPVQVTAISQMPSGFKLTVRNVGGGTPYYNQTNPTSKDVKIDYNNKDRAHIKSAKIGSIDVDPSTKCAPSTLYLINNEATAFCTYDFTKDVTGTYTEVLTLELEYGYRQEIGTTLKILDIA
jgi:hypothetical protein